MTRPRVEMRDYFVLRAEWLRFKNHVLDANTGLPTLVAVLDDVRRLVEERGSLGLVYLDLGANAGVETLHGWQAYDDLLRTIAGGLASLRDDGSLGPRDVVAGLAVRSDKFLVFLGGSGASPMEPDQLGAAAERLRDQLVRKVSGHLPPFVSRPLRLAVGHSLLFRDPMLRAERTVHRALDAAVRMSLAERVREESRRDQGLETILHDDHVVSWYQPIVDLADRSVLGHEVFSRGPEGSALEDPELLFKAAARTGRLLELERLCRRHALSSSRHHLPSGSKLFLNTSTPALQDPTLSTGLLDGIRHAGLPTRNVVLEITERVAVEDRSANQEGLERLRGQGVGIAIDDMGAGYSSLQAIVELEPDFLKFDVALVRNIDRSRIKRSLLETVVDLARRIGAGVIAEGIESQAEYDTLLEMGVRLGQGHFLAPPERISEDASA